LEDRLLGGAGCWSGSLMQQIDRGLVWIENVDFSSGVIEAEIAGALAPGAASDARGFVGIAFRVHEDLQTYDAFYLRPTNGRAEDQERRNHSVQYISLPERPWFRLRQATPGRYEAYVDLAPGAWTKIKSRDAKRVRRASAAKATHTKIRP
jgi:hypothetical protein